MRRPQDLTKNFHGQTDPRGKQITSFYCLSIQQPPTAGMLSDSLPYFKSISAAVNEEESDDARVL